MAHGRDRLIGTVRFLAQRLLAGVVTLWVASVFVFLMIRLVPGDAISTILGQAYDPVAAEALRERYGMSGNILTQYLNWVLPLFRGDFGVSLLTRSPIGPELAARLARSLQLLVGSIGVGLLIALPSGYLAARRRGGATDISVMAFTTTMMSIPQFVLGLILLVVATVTPTGFTTTGWVDPSMGLVPWVQSMGLAWLTLGLAMSAFTSRVFRSSLIEESQRDYVRTALATGLPKGLIWTGHIVRNAALPTITVVGLEVGYLLGGAIVIEKVFAIPGMGQYIVDSISNRDYPAVQAAVLAFAAGFIIINLVVDVLYVLIDPRIRGAQ